MTREAKTLVPRLRFPEFRNTAGWKTKILGTQGSFLSSLTGKTTKDFDTGDAAFIPYMNVFSNAFTNTTDLRSVNVADNESQNAVAKRDVFFTVSSETPEEAGMSSVLLAEIGNCYLNSFCALFRFDEGKSPEPVFLGYLLRSAPAREHLSRGAQGATRYNISRATFRNLPILIPSRPEQQKIADCLGSLDDMITAEGRKLEALQQHKHGLMQQLFPKPGETVPKLRFPEFESAGNWRKLRLVDVADKNTKWSFIGGPFGSNLKSSDYVSEGIRVIQLQNIGDAEFVDDYKIFTSYEKADELQSNNIYPGEIILSKMGDPVGRACLIPDTNHRYVMCSDGIRLVVDEKQYSKYFIYVLINSTHFRLLVENTATGSTRKRIGLDDLKNLPLQIPSAPEQQKIADCLGSLDNLIAAENRKLEALRKHKQGLMQQLFPSLETEPR